MNVQWAGLVLAVITFATIGIGHVLVRELYKPFSTRPAIPFFLLGLVVMYFSLTAASDLVSAALGLIAITFMWDGYEFYRQKKRVEREKGA